MASVIFIRNSLVLCCVAGIAFTALWTDEEVGSRALNTPGSIPQSPRNESTPQFVVDGSDESGFQKKVVPSSEHNGETDAAGALGTERSVYIPLSTAFETGQIARTVDRSDLRGVKTVFCPQCYIRDGTTGSAPVAERHVLTVEVNGNPIHAGKARFVNNPPKRQPRVVQYSYVAGLSLVPRTTTARDPREVERSLRQGVF